MRDRKVNGLEVGMARWPMDGLVEWDGIAPKWSFRFSKGSNDVLLH
jgi:hypothetical protein